MSMAAEIAISELRIYHWTYAAIVVFGIVGGLLILALR